MGLKKTVKRVLFNRVDDERIKLIILDHNNNYNSTQKATEICLLKIKGIHHFSWMSVLIFKKRAEIKVSSPWTCEKNKYVNKIWKPNGKKYTQCVSYLKNGDDESNTNLKV